MPVGTSDISFYQCSREVIDERLCPHLNSALVFLDDAFAEIIHWHGGAATLFNVGAVDVREFSSFESGNISHLKAVFCISNALSSPSILDTLRDIISASHFISVVIVTSVCSPMHSIIEYGPANVGDDDTRAFVLFRNQILEWLQLKTPERCSLKLVALPLVMVPILPSFFTLPAFADTFPLLTNDIDYILHRHNTGDARPSSTHDIDFGRLPQQLQLRFKLLACALDSVLEVLNCSEDIFALGRTSGVIAAELANLSWSKSRRKAAQLKASLLLVDRTLDLASVVGHFHDTLLDKMVSVLPRLPGHRTDIQVDMCPVCTVTSNPDFRVIAPGCLAHPDDISATSLLNALAMLKHKEALTEINRQITDAAVKESLTDNTSPAFRPGKSVTVDQIESQLQHFRGKAGSIRKYCGLLQLGLAATQLLRHHDLLKFDTMLAEEKGLLQCFGDDDAPSPIIQIIKTLQKQSTLPPSERTHSVDDILLLITFIMSLKSADSVVDQNEMEQLTDAFYQLLCESQATCSQIFHQLVGENFDEIKCSKVVHDVLKKLSSLCRSREGLKRYREIYEPGSLTSQARLRPLLRQIVEDIVDPGRPDLTDIAHKSGGFGDLLKSGFGLFRSVAKPRPGDHPLLIIFVVGGATATEVRQIRDAVAAAKTNVQVVVGSTALVNPADVLHRLLLQDNLHPK